MYRIGDLREIHLEPSERCNASCPMCARNNHGTGVNPGIRGRELRAADLAAWFSADLLRQLERIRLCGNFGDPAVCREALDICILLRRSNPRLLLTLNTNGSVRDGKWWFELGRLFHEPGNAVQFAIDGLADTHERYRRGTSFERILGNAEAFIRGGGRAHWVYLVFEHNERHVDEARELARRLGFSQFTVKATKRFLKSHRMVVAEEFPVFGSGGEKLYDLRPAKSPRHQNAALQRLGAIGGSPAAAALLSEVEISCKAAEERSLYVSAEGLVFPCCWTASSIYPPGSVDSGPHGAGSGEIWDLLESCGGPQSISLHRSALCEIVGGAFFAAVARSWAPGNLARLKICARLCGLGIGSFDAQFRHDQLARPKEEELRQFAL